MGKISEVGQFHFVISLRLFMEFLHLAVKDVLDLIKACVVLRPFYKDQKK